MDALFETPAPFIIKIYFNHFQITWAGSVESPQDTYPYDKIKAISVIAGKKTRTWIEFIFDLFTHNQLSRKIDAYDELLIVFKSGETETRYLHGEVTEAIDEALEIIRSKLNKR